MKNTILLLLMVVYSSLSFAQECNSYFPQEKGKVLEYRDLDKKGKETGRMTREVVERRLQGSVLSVQIKETHTPKKGNSTTVKYSVKCEDGLAFVSMEGYAMGQPQMSAYNNMSTEIEADNLEIPNDAKVGDDLGVGKVKATVYNENIKMFSLDFKILDRKVDAFEKLTTNAGTFDCMKITSHTEMHMMITIKTTTVEWYAKDIGVVKSEVYSKKGKLMSSTVLESIKLSSM